MSDESKTTVYIVTPDLEPSILEITYDSSNDTIQ